MNKKIKKSLVYDVAVIGAGINGCSSAYFLSQAEQNVVLIDQEKIAAGGSGAAGAFISPKFTKGGDLKEILEEAYLFSLDFYSRHFPDIIRNAQLLQIANSPENAHRMQDFKTNTRLAFREDSSAVEEILTADAKKSDMLLLEKGGVVDAEVMCRALAENIDFVQAKVDQLEYCAGYWQVGDVQAKRIVLATGSYDGVVKMPYLSLRRVWGHRIDIETSTKVPYSIHHHLSISPSNEAGVVAIGATHNLHFNPFSDALYDVEAGRAELLKKASESVILKDIKVLKDYTGLRSGSNDYLPIIGPVVDAEKSMADDFNISKLKYMTSADFSYYRELYMINGTGGYGFVLAPYLAKQLCMDMLEGKGMNHALAPERFFRRWAKKQR